MAWGEGQWLVTRQPGAAPEWIPPGEVVRLVEAGMLSPWAWVSTDGGHTYRHAAEARGVLESQRIAGAIVPGRVGAWALAGQWISLLYFLFIGGPLTVIPPVLAFDEGCSRPARLAVTAVVLVVSGGPIFALWALARRERRRDPSLGGGMRVTMMLVLGALIVLPCLFAALSSLVTPVK